MPTTTTNEKRNTKLNGYHRRHAAAIAHHHGGHQHLHNRHAKIKEVEESQLSKRAVGDLVFATIDGQRVSWTNVYAGPGVATDAPVFEAVADMSTLKSDLDTDTTEDIDRTSQTSTSSSAMTTNTPSSGIATAPATSQGWVRQAYFNAASGTAEGLTFLNHFGDTDGIPGTTAGGPALENFDHVGP